MQTASDTESRSREILRNLPQIDGVIPMYVGGGWRLAGDGATRELFNPADGTPVAVVAEASATDAEAAIAAARRAFDDGPWSTTSAADRAALLFKVADAIDANRDELMRIDTLNNGKPLRETEYDAIDAANCFRYYAGLATKPHGQTFDVPAPSQTFTVREPIGVCGQIVPWNYPLLMAVWKLASGACRRQRLRAKARGADAALDDPARRDLPRARVSAGRGQRRHRRGRDGRSRDRRKHARR